LTQVEELAYFASSRSFDDLSDSAIRELKIRILDSLGCAAGAMKAQPIKILRKFEGELGGVPRCTLFGSGKSSPDRAAFYNGSLVRYLDFNDSFLAKNETCHPSDNLAPILAAAEYAGASGKDLLVALGVAYQVQCRLSEVAPVRDKGFDHVTQGAYAVAAGSSRALGLDQARTANAIAISGTALNALRVTRTGKLSNWKGLAYPFMASGAIQATILATEGITGPLEVFEGNKGFMDAISGRFEIAWHSENLELVTRTILKKYNAEVHSQSAIECMLKLRSKGLSVQEVDSIDVKTFDVAFKIIGGGEEGEKKESIEKKEQADHSLPYILAVALLDGKVMPEEYSQERIMSSDVQTLLRKIHVGSDPEFSKMFPNAMPCEITVKTKSEKVLRESTTDYEGFFTRPMSWGEAEKKFQILSSPNLDSDARSEILTTIESLENRSAADLTTLLRG
jgi:2-methylcitrate dehydratase